jgi:adenosylhomocysteinase
MPGLMAIREEFAKSQPLKGARITGPLHVTIQTALLLDLRPVAGARGGYANAPFSFSQRVKPGH